MYRKKSDWAKIMVFFFFSFYLNYSVFFTNQVQDLTESFNLHYFRGHDSKYWLSNDIDWPIIL